MSCDVNPESRIRILIFYPSRIPDPEVKKAPDPGSQIRNIAKTHTSEKVNFSRAHKTWTRQTNELLSDPNQVLTCLLDPLFGTVNERCTYSSYRTIQVKQLKFKQNLIYMSKFCSLGVGGGGALTVKDKWRRKLQCEGKWTVKTDVFFTAQNNLRQTEEIRI